ncbi:hypothetical protein [Polyangium mundeleinium]|uniref:Uncharacterized protein n=1 Tax=Polyangium mundeleinium TaxID=2995306 RepID=A0ABT5F1M1_9BACT|nr:hypothetical protein [Polyangium mundeleinium]MDC0747983.1 hypothetical protein [Polyangium mundeleinium]
MISNRSFVAISFAVVPLVLFACAKGNTRPGGEGGAGGEGGDGWGGPAQSSSGSGGMGGSGGMSGASSSGAGASSSSSSASSGSGSSSSSGSGGGGSGPLPIVLLRIGDGVTTLSSAASPVTIEWRLTDGSAMPGSPGTTAMPQVISGSNYNLTLSGTASSEGHLSLSANGKYVFLAGYVADVGAPNVSTQLVSRVVGRVDAFGNVNTSTLLSGAFNASNVRGATSSDGTSIWVSGNSATSGGIHHITLGSNAPTQILANPLNTRCVQVSGGQLYATSGAGTFVNVFTVGSGLPTSVGQTATSLPGLPTASASPYGFVLLDLSAGIAGPDTLYIADDRSPANGGGIQKWTFDGFSWSLAATWNDGTAGVRGLAATPSGGGVRVVATTAENNENRVLTLFDDGSAFPEIVIATIAPPNTVFRGVAFAPQ